jgi:hypothetical protein
MPSPRLLKAVSFAKSRAAGYYFVMSKAATLPTAERESGYQAQAEYYLAETNRIIKRLANERARHKRRRDDHPSILEQVKSILRGA